MENRKAKHPREAGRYLEPSPQPPSRRRRPVKWKRLVVVLVLLSWDGLLLYMILRCLIVPVYGGLFLAAVSVCLGYQLKQEG